MIQPPPLNRLFQFLKLTRSKLTIPPISFFRMFGQVALAGCVELYERLAVLVISKDEISVSKEPCKAQSKPIIFWNCLHSLFVRLHTAIYQTAFSKVGETARFACDCLRRKKHLTRFSANFGITVLCASCVVYDHEAVSSTGNKEHDKLWSLGGTNSQHGADGSSLVTDHQASFQQAVQAIGTVAAGAAAASVSKAMETTKQLSNAAAAKTAQAQISATAATTNATTAARTATTNTAIGAGAPLTPVTVNPP